MFIAILSFVNAGSHTV